MRYLLLAVLALAGCHKQNPLQPPIVQQQQMVTVVGTSGAIYTALDLETAIHVCKIDYKEIVCYAQ